MDEVSAKARLADGVESPLAVAVPRAGVEEALQDEGADLILDLVRTNGQREERRIILSVDRQALEALAMQEGEQVLVALDAQTLAGAFDEDVEAHGLREAGAAFAILVTAAAGGAGMAGAAVDQQGAGQAGSASYVPFQSDFPTVQASVDRSGQYGMPRPTASDYAASEGQMPRAMPSDYAAADDSSATLRRDPGAMPTGPGVSQAEPRGIENIRASQPPPVEAPDPAAGIEAVRVGGTAVPDPSTGIENVRAQRGPSEVGGGGATISAPSTGAAVAIAGGAMLTIAAAAFALRRRREPGLA